MTTATSAPRSGQPPQPGRELPEPRSFYDVPGWFYRTDVILFDWFLQRQRQLGQRGDLLEMGSYMGKSAVMMRAYLDTPEEKFTVCDLFDSEAPDEANGREMRGSYATLTRRAFEANFLSFHDDLPRIVQAPTSVVPREITPDSCRFVHVDASHLYEHVHGDIGAARQVLAPGGIVVLDDYRSEHTPGVACATWQAVLESGLRPVCVSGHKFYGTWGEAEPWQDALHAALTARGKCWLQWQVVAGRRMLLVGAKKADAPEVPASRHARGQALLTPEAAPRRRGMARKVAVDLLPPVVTRALVSARRRSGRP
ncbi:class I SAM-dependent methyltransferase [Streptomyces iconiensis]|uniref:Class I SAM-dependent methyltransferase n=1 Tax=Streptomyces iconiensis TaxID=1384038 RepID=A0ABT7AAH5_9ACTN|nr:class I SAM-dependent methyltransferase [Streptomyces iconiensis]MDJ1137608.1 class I SAM-dependent methyltransferase [Streptomyces iconiensis]